jgi:hypothetical protein
MGRVFTPAVYDPGDHVVCGAKYIHSIQYRLELE